MVKHKYFSNYFIWFCHLTTFLAYLIVITPKNNLKVDKMPSPFKAFKQKWRTTKEYNFNLLSFKFKMKICKFSSNFHLFS
jgi:hypothetical protein